MKIDIQIERLILSGVDVSQSQRVKLQGAIEAELARLVTVNGLPPTLKNGGMISKLPTDINVTKTTEPVQMGQQIAQSIYEGFNL